MDQTSRLEEKLDRMLTEINSLNVRITRIESRLDSIEKSYEKNNQFLDRVRSDALIREFEFRDSHNRLGKLEEITNALYQDHQKLRWLVKFSEDASYRITWLIITLVLLSVMSSVSNDLIQSLIMRFFK